MRSKRPRLLMALLTLTLPILLPVSGIAQGSAEDLKPYPASPEVIVNFLERYGFTKHGFTKQKVIAREGEKEQLIAFKVTEKTSGETLDFLVVLIPAGRILKIECPSLALVPSDSNKFYTMLAKLNDLNANRTIGKYCTDPDRKKVRYFHYRTVAGGICYSDFIDTLKMIQYIVFTDLKAIREVAS